MSTLSDAILAWNGATGANGVFAMRDAFLMNEASGNLAALFGSRVATPIGSPTYRAAGFEENLGAGESSYSITLGTGKGFDLGAVGDLRQDINNNGLFFGGLVNHSESGTRAPLLTSYNSDSSQGFGFLLNAFGTTQFGGVATADMRAGGGFYSAFKWRTDMVCWGRPVWWFMYLKRPATVKIWIAGMPLVLTPSNTNGGTVGTLAGGSTDRLAISAMATGSGAPTVAAGDCLIGGGSHFFWGHGEPTQKMMRDVVRATTYTVKRVPGVIRHHRMLPEYCWADFARTTPATKTQAVKGVTDLSPHGNHSGLDQANVPTLQKEINAGSGEGGRWCLCFDNFFANWNVYGNPANPGGTDPNFKQQTLECVMASTKMVQGLIGGIAVCRPMLSYRPQWLTQNVLEYRAAGGTLLHALSVHPTAREVGTFRSTTAFAAAAMESELLVAPGISVMGTSTGQTGDQTAAADVLVFNNRFQSVLASGYNADEAYVTRLNIAGPKDQGSLNGGLLSWSGWIEETVDGCFGITSDEAADFAALTIAEVGEMLIPEFKVVGIGDSILGGLDSRNCRTLLTALPAGSSKRTAYSIIPIPSGAVQDSVPAYDANLSLVKATLSAKQKDAGARRHIVFGQAGVNDALAGDSQATFYGEMWSNGANLPDVGGVSMGSTKGMLDQLRTLGWDAIYWNRIASNGGGGAAAINAALEQLLAEHRIDGLVTLDEGSYTYGPHPDPILQVSWAGNWWNQALRAEVGSEDLGYWRRIGMMAAAAGVR